MKKIDFISFVTVSFLLLSCSGNVKNGESSSQAEEVRELNSSSIVETTKEETSPCSDEVKKDGALVKGVFKVSDTQSVRFSQGNLQYNAGNGKMHKTATGEAQGTWRFAENQWDVIGEGNAYASADYDGWIDLFGWGTCGWSESGAKAYEPWSKSQLGRDYYDGKELSDADWGAFNAISNGGNEPGMWRTLTHEEWNYLVENNKWTMGTVEGMLCFMLIPSDFPYQNKVAFVNVNIKRDDEYGDSYWFSSEDYVKNEYTAEEFKEFEEYGVVALPCAGESMYGVGESGGYWSSSDNGSGCVYLLNFNSTSYCSIGCCVNGSAGRSVRLVQDF